MPINFDYVNSVQIFLVGSLKYFFLVFEIFFVTDFSIFPNENDAFQKFIYVLVNILSIFVIWVIN